MITINNNFDLESLQVGKTCKIRGLKKGSATLSDNMQIESLRYSPDKVILTLGDATNFADEIKKL